MIYKQVTSDIGALLGSGKLKLPASRKITEGLLILEKSHIFCETDDINYLIDKAKNAKRKISPKIIEMDSI